MLNSIKSLIGIGLYFLLYKIFIFVYLFLGCFNLDPNRVLDIILECFEARILLKDSFIPLIKNFLDNPSTLNQILAFKFNFYNNVSGVKATKVSKRPYKYFHFDT